MNSEKTNGGGKKVFLAIPRQQGEDKTMYLQRVVTYSVRYKAEHPSLAVYHLVDDTKVNMHNLIECEEVVFFKGWEEDTYCVTYNRMAKDLQIVMTYEQPIHELIKGK